MLETPRGRNGRTRVIVVDADDADDARDGTRIESALVDLGYEIAPAVGGQDSMNENSARPVPAATEADVIVVDVGRQLESDCLERARELRKRFQLPVVFITSYSDDESLAYIKNSGIEAWLLAPFTPRELRTAIDVALEKHRLERRLAERERWFSMALEALGDAVIATDPRQRVIFVNAAAESLTGFSADDAVGKHVNDVLQRVDPESKSARESLVSIALGEGRCVRADGPVEIVQRDGERVAVDDSCAPIAGDDGELLGAIIVCRDMTERVRMEQRLAQAARLAAIGTMASGVAHEISNPLTYVVANTNFALEGAARARDALGTLRDAKGEVSKEILEIERLLCEVRDGAHRVQNVIRDLRRFSRTNGPARTAVDLRDPIANALKITHHAVMHHARVETNLSAVPKIEGDVAQLSQVLVNLILNAVDAMQNAMAGGNQISIRTYSDVEGRAVVSVSDTGCGIPRSELGRVFDPFYTTKSIGDGIGLGLSICHNIVTGFDGEIRIESEEGRGTTVYLLFPPMSRGLISDAIAPEKASPSLRASTDTDDKVRRILVVDDEELVAKVVARLLGKDHAVVIEIDPRSAIARIERGEHFDAILCDLMMPGMTGMDFYESLSCLAPDMAKRIVFLTGGAFTTRASDFLNAVQNPWIPKPFTRENLRTVLGEHLRIVSSAG